MEIHVGNIVKVKSVSQGASGNGVNEDNTIAEIVDYDKFNKHPNTSGLIDNKYNNMYIIKFNHKGFTNYRRIIKDHIIEVITTNKINKKSMEKQMLDVLNKTYDNLILRRTTVPLFMSNPGKVLKWLK